MARGRRIVVRARRKRTDGPLPPRGRGGGGAAVTIIKRSALVFHGHNPAPDVAEIVVDHRGRHVVTWDDVLAARRERQRRQLEDKRRVVPWRPAKLWVAY